MILLDTSILSYLLNPHARPPIDTATGQPVTHCAARIEHFIAHHAKAKIVVAMPSVAELLVIAGEHMEEFLARIDKASALRLMPFDKAAAMECALMEQEAKIAGDKKGDGEASWQKVKVDRQILAIGRVAGVVDFYSDDTNLRKMALRLGISVKSISDMPIPPEAAQQKLDLVIEPST